MWIYLLKFSACLAILLLFYKLVLEKVHIHHFKRYYLLSVFIISLSIPLITFTQYVTVTIDPSLLPTYIDQSSSYSIENKNNTTPMLPIILWGIYALGAFIFALKFLGNLRSLIKNIKSNPKLKSGRIHHVLLQELIAPHTFFSYIFFNKKNYEAHKIPQEVFWHEETHARQKHSLDILLLELIQIVFWFHPLIYWAKHLAKLNHEFLADQAVLKRGASVPNYQKMILAFSSSDSYRNAVTPPLANAIHYSSIKKRIVIMKTQTSKKAIWLRSLLLLPLIALLLYGFSSTKILEKVVTPETIKSSIQKDSLIGAAENMMQEYRNYIDNLGKSDNIIIKQTEYNRIEAIYELMTDKQQASVTDYRDIVKLPNLNISKTKSNKPSETEFDSWKDNKKFAIWIDGKHVPNTTLGHYSTADIIHFTSSFVYNNARSEKFPQPYQNRLYTKNGFKEAYTQYDIIKYNELSNQYEKEIMLFNKKEQEDNSELRILRIKLDQLYRNFSKDELEKYDLLPPLPVPDEINNKIKFGQNTSNQDIRILINNKGQLLLNSHKVKIEDLKSHLQKYNQGLTKEQREQSVRAVISVEKETPANIIKQVDAILMEYGVATIDIKGPTPSQNQVGATKSKLQEYNTLAKKYNAQPQETRVIPLKDLKTLENIYGSMTDDQKEQAQPFPECPPPPPPAPVPAPSPNPVPPIKKGKPSTIPPASTPSKTETKVEDKEKLGTNNHISKKVVLKAELVPVVSSDFPPPPPTIATNVNTENYSKEVKNAINTYLKKARSYRAAVSNYHNEHKGSINELKKTYSEVMKLYAAYKKLAVEENVFFHPVPLYNDPKGEFGNPNTTSQIKQDNLPSQTIKSSTNQKQERIKESSLYYGNLYNLPQLPPQPHPNPVQYIKELAEKGATFYIGPHQYKTAEAIELVRKSKNASIDVSDYPVVKLGGC